MVSSLIGSPELPPCCGQPAGSRHGHSRPAGSCLSLYVLRVSPESSHRSQCCSSRTMPNLSRHLSAQPPASAPRTWMQSRSQPENGKTPSDPVHEQLLFIYPGSFLPRKDGAGDEALPTPLGLPLRGCCEVRGMPQSGGNTHSRQSCERTVADLAFPSTAPGTRGKPTSVCGGAGPAPVSCGGGQRKKPAVGLQTRATPQRWGMFSKIAFFSAFLSLPATPPP